MAGQISASANGEMTKQGESYAVRFERHYDHPAATVWDAISNPDTIAKWLANATIDMQEGGGIKLEFINYPDVMHGVITELKPLSVLEYTWQEKNGPKGLVRWELYADGADKCRMVLLHTHLGNDAHAFGSGWHTHLEMMEGVLDGTVTEFSWNEPLWKQRDVVYKQLMSEL